MFQPSRARKRNTTLTDEHLIHAAGKQPRQCNSWSPQVKESKERERDRRWNSTRTHLFPIPIVQLFVLRTSGVKCYEMLGRTFLLLHSYLFFPTQKLPLVTRSLHTNGNKGRRRHVPNSSRCTPKTHTCAPFGVGARNQPCCCTMYDPFRDTRNTRKAKRTQKLCTRIQYFGEKKKTTGFT